MYEFIQMLSNFLSRVMNVLGTAIFDIGGVVVSLSDILLGFLALSIVITVFWKGARA